MKLPFSVVWRVLGFPQLKLYSIFRDNRGHLKPWLCLCNSWFAINIEWRFFQCRFNCIFICSFLVRLKQKTIIISSLRLFVCIFVFILFCVICILFFFFSLFIVCSLFIQLLVCSSPKWLSIHNAKVELGNKWISILDYWDQLWIFHGAFLMIWTDKMVCNNVARNRLD